MNLKKKKIYSWNKNSKGKLDKLFFLSKKIGHPTNPEKYWNGIEIEGMTCLQLSSSIVVAKLKSHGDKMSEPDSMAHGFKQSRCRERVERRHKMTSHFPNFLRWPFFPPFFFHISRRQWGTLGWESMVNDNTKYCPACSSRDCSQDALWCFTTASCSRHCHYFSFMLIEQRRQGSVFQLTESLNFWILQCT